MDRINKSDKEILWEIAFVVLIGVILFLTFWVGGLAFGESNDETGLQTSQIGLSRSISGALGAGLGSQYPQIVSGGLSG